MKYTPYNFIFILFTLCLLVIGCANEGASEASVTSSESTAALQPTPDVEGQWSFIVRNTPQGDYQGDLALVKEANGYSGTMASGAGETELEDLVIKGNEMNFSIMAEGYLAKVNGQFSGATFSGKVSVQGYDFPFEAIKK